MKRELIVKLHPNKSLVTKTATLATSGTLRFAKVGIRTQGRKG